MIVETITALIAYLGTIFTIGDAAILLALLDIILGWLPDNYTKYRGVIIKIFTRMYFTGKSK